MTYYRTDKDGYLLSISTATGETEITEEEYLHIQSVLANKPEGNYLLTSDLEWESYTPEEPTEDEPTAEELLAMLEEIL